MADLSEHGEGSTGGEKCPHLPRFATGEAGQEEWVLHVQQPLRPSGPLRHTPDGRVCSRTCPLSVSVASIQSREPTTLADERRRNHEARTVVSTERACRRVHQPSLTGMRLGLSLSTFGRTMVTTPFLCLALTFSESTEAGSETLRRNEPKRRSL